MKIIVVSAFYSKGMGYVENCLPKAFASLGHEVHVITSNLNVYGNEANYQHTYESFLGPADQGTGSFEADGYTVHRLPSKIFSGYVFIKGMLRLINRISPDIIHSIEIASLNTFLLSACKPLFKYKLYTETHQHMSVVKPFLKDKKGNFGKRILYKFTRTLPTYLSSLFIKKCYAISPDCAEVANKFYGVPVKKLKIQPLGTDTDLFRPFRTELELKIRSELRHELGFSEKDIVCIYTGRFSKDKDPLLLAVAIDKLNSQNLPYFGLFIGDGSQLEDIQKYPSVKVVKFVRYMELARYYSLSDIAVWPRQESLSMLDAASAGIPVIVSDTMGDSERIHGNGKQFKEGDADDLCNVLKSLQGYDERIILGDFGRQKMLSNYSWKQIAKNLIGDFSN